MKIRHAVAAAIVATFIGGAALAAPPPGRRTGSDNPGNCWLTSSGWQCPTPTTVP